MFNKLYKEVKKIMIENHNFLLFLIFFALILNIKFPYYIYRPGGTIDLNNRIKLDGKSINNNYASTYVTMSDASLVSIIMSYIIPNWDLERIPDVEHSSYDSKIDTLEIENSNLIAKKYVLNKLNIPYTEENSKVVVLSPFFDFKNDLKPGDIIYKCDDLDIKYIDDLNLCVDNSKSNFVNLKVKRNHKNKNLKAKINNYQGRKVIGISVYRDYDIKSTPDVDIKHLEDELGPSGGFITALALYDALNNSNYSLKYKISGTGTIDEDGKIGEIGGIKYKLMGADKDKVDIFFVPEDNYDEALYFYNKFKYKFKLVLVKEFDDAIIYLESIK